MKLGAEPGRGEPVDDGRRAGRSAEERRGFIRSRGQFEAIFEIQLSVSAPNPAEDREWNDRTRREPRPDAGAE